MNKYKMKLITSTFTFLLILPMTLSIDNEKVSKAVCSLSVSKSVDLLIESSVNSIKLSKTLFQDCGIKIRFLSELSGVDDFLISFITPQTNQKEKI